jgi:hypothetical protein
MPVSGGPDGNIAIGAIFAPKKPQDSGNNAPLIGDIPKPPQAQSTTT